MFLITVEAVVETFVSMKEQLNTEKRALNKQWNCREQQIERVMFNISGMYGDMQGLMGASLPEIKLLELED